MISLPKAEVTEEANVWKPNLRTASYPLSQRNITRTFDENQPKILVVMTRSRSVNCYATYWNTKVVESTWLR